MKIEDLEQLSNQLLKSYIGWLNMYEVTGERVVEVFKLNQAVTVQLINTLIPEDKVEDISKMYINTLKQSFDEFEREED